MCVCVSLRYITLQKLRLNGLVVSVSAFHVEESYHHKNDTICLSTWHAGVRVGYLPRFELGSVACSPR